MARPLTTAVCVAVALTAAACGSSGGRHAGVRLRGSAVPVAVLTDRLADGLAATTTVHVDLAVDAQGRQTRISADEQLRHGRPRAMQVDSDSLGLGGPVRILAVGGKIFARGPVSVNPTGRPWVLVTSHSRSGEIRRIAQAIDLAQTSVAPGQVTALAHAATAATRVGPAGIDATATTHYEMSVDVTKLPADFPGKKVLGLLSSEAVPVDLYLDNASRPVRAALHVSVVGQDVALRIDTSRYGQRVVITAPPPDTVGQA